MNNILKKILFIFFIFAANSCSYKPIFLDKNYDFEINEVFFNGEKDINRIIDSKLKFIKKSEDRKKKSYTIELTSTKKREIVSNDSKGDPLKFEMNILVEYKIMNNEKILLKNEVEKNNIYNNDSDQFKLEQTEEIIIENLTGSISDIIISSIINLDDN